MAKKVKMISAHWGREIHYTKYRNPYIEFAILV